MPQSARRRTVVAAALATTALVAVTSCSTPPWEMQPSGSPGSSASGSSGGSPSAPSSAGSSAESTSSAAASGPAASPGGSAASPPAPSSSAGSGTTNDLAQGSTRRTLTAGEARITIDYWSTLPIEQWSPEIPKPLSLSVSVAPPSGTSGRGVFLSRVTLTPVAQAGPTVVGAVPVQTDAATVQPGYDVLAPRSYQQVFVLPGVDPTATSVTLTLTYELLIETTATSEQYAKQTGQDTITVALT